MSTATATASVASDFVAPAETNPVEVIAVARAGRRELFMFCAENRVEDEYDGGLVLFQGVRGQHTDELVDCRLVCSFKHDEPMRDYPVTRAEKQERFFRVTIEEIAFAEIPPDPTLPKPASAFDLLVQARAAAMREGDTARADAITQQLNDGVAVSAAAAPASAPPLADDAAPAGSSATS